MGMTTVWTCDCCGVTSSSADATPVPMETLQLWGMPSQTLCGPTQNSCYEVAMAKLARFAAFFALHTDHTQPHPDTPMSI